jgi:hypothetical protein
MFQFVKGLPGTKVAVELVDVHVAPFKICRHCFLQP